MHFEYRSKGKIFLAKLLYKAYLWKQRFLNISFIGNRYQCNICGTTLNRFISLPEIADGLFMKNLNIRGKKYLISDYETLNVENFLCPICGSQDKARLYELFISQKFENEAIHKPKSKRFVHFAPEGGLPERIKRFSFLKYSTADLQRNDVDEKADLTELQYKSNSVDFFICSHILEHIPDDKKAVSELFRVLKKSGWGILTVPILSPLKTTYENNKITTEKGRLLHFGQRDHVRVYAKNGFLHLLTSAGFKVHEFSSKDFGVSVFQRHGITLQSILYIVSK